MCVVCMYHMTRCFNSFNVYVLSNYHITLLQQLTNHPACQYYVNQHCKYHLSCKMITKVHNKKLNCECMAMQLELIMSQLCYLGLNCKSRYVSSLASLFTCSIVKQHRCCIIMYNVTLSHYISTIAMFSATSQFTLKLTYCSIYNYNYKNEHRNKVSR